ncbi:MAG: hypothetical protein ACK5NT_04260 [Pyrinomonadaceae bacterium]
MATFRDPVQCFAPIEVVERFLEIREDSGFPQVLYAPSTTELADFFDAYGFNVYSFSSSEKELNFGLYRSPVVPGGSNERTSITAH